jgi:hypothetical protein
MKANELRIGNYVQDAGGRIQKISSSLLVAIIEKVITFSEPIPLTEEWMLKFGFEKTQKSYNGKIAAIIDFQLWQGYDTDYWNFSTVDDRGDNNEVNVNLYFVHQLQNLYFALTGKELTV